MTWVINASEEVDAQSQWQSILAVCLVLSTLSIATVSARLWIRYKARGMAADDWFAFAAMMFALIYSILCIAQTKFGLGLPIALRPAANLIPYTRVNFSGRPFYQLGISFFKIALLISYLRLFEGTNERIYRRIVWFSAITIFLAHLGCTLSLIFACNPVHKSWDPLTPGTCLPNGPSFTGYAVVTIISDIVVSILPVPVLLKLNIPRSKKVALVGIFLLGLFTTVCSIMRYMQIDRIQYGDGNSTGLILWGTIEFNVGNMVSSLPFLAPIFVKKAREYRTKKSGSNSTPRIGRSGDHYKLSSINRDRSAFVSSNGMESGSEENILKHGKDGVILKSVTVQIDKEEREGSHTPVPRGF
ncbi:integral membrane protein [Thozetella sp. PMI_491]|nr:integral membrane protein [Thozetella sp. PMI_491]